MAARLQPDPAEPHVRAEIVHQLSVMFRSRGRISDSERVITEFFSSQSLDLNRESHYFLGLLHLSQANNQAYRFEFCRAREETCKWQPSSDTLSDCELRLLCDQLCTSGRILRGEGWFNEARRCFEGCLVTPGLPRSKRLLVISHLSDVYCELDYIQQNNAYQLTLQSSYLNKGREVVQQEINCARACGKPLKGLKRLLLSLTEIEIRQYRFDRAECIISELLDIYSKIAEPDVNDRVGHVRTLIARARISQLCEAEEHWNAALLQNRAYNPFEEEVFTCGVIYLFISSARFQLDDVDGSRGTFKKAIEVIRRKRPQFLMPGMGTYLFDSIRSELQSRAGLILPEIAQ
jgi:tetratricopeptide (TPR) repeat protein